VSAGNTGAVMAISKMVIGVVPGVDRPALAAIVPTLSGHAVLIDVGANISCKPHQLVQFAIMGHLFSKKIIGVNSPRVGLMSVGEEESKGTDLTKEVHRALKDVRLNFIGNVEGFDVMKGKADIIVMDGFTGNIMLKTIEGYSEVIQKLLELQEASELDRQLAGTALAQYVEMTSAMKKLDYKEIGGAFLLGVNGNVVVAHGRSRAKALKGAIHLAYLAARQGVIEAIKNHQFASG